MEVVILMVFLFQALIDLTRFAIFYDGLFLYKIHGPRQLFNTGE